MINTAELEQYFPEPNKPITIGVYTFTISLSQDDLKEIFIVNLKIKQKDNKEDHLIKFRLGIGQDLKKENAIHETNKPHFEIDLYKREKESLSAIVYFTFNETDDEKIMKYAKGTVSIINKIIKNFCENKKIDKKFINELIYENEVKKELLKFEQVLVDALYECYKNSEMIVKEDGKPVEIRTEHNFKKYLNVKDLEPLCLPLLKKIESE